MALPTPSTIPEPLSDVLPALPKSWSELSWRQLCGCWQCKVRYGGNQDVARAAALLALLGLEPSRGDREAHDPVTGEAVYLLQPVSGSKFFTLHSSLFTLTPRELSQTAQQALPWFQYPYGDPGKEAVKDEKGKVLEEAVEPVRGYVNPDWLGDAMALPEETVVVVGDRLLTGTEWKAMSDKERKQILRSCSSSEPAHARQSQCKHHSALAHSQPSLFTLHFQLPSVACYNLTWQQYRALQAIAPQLFQEGTGDDGVLDLQAQFLAHCLVPAKEGGATADPFAPPQVFTYEPDRAEQTVGYWRSKLKMEFSILFHLCFQVYQTAMRYYEQVFPLLFSGGGKNDPLQDALAGEVRTLNAVMKYQGYTKPEDVYAENLPNILSTLNTMAEEAKQIETMNARIRRKR